MNKCLRIMMISDLADSGKAFVQKQARKFFLEGAVQADEEGKTKIIVFGPKPKVDSFIDSLHKNKSLNEIEIEPFLKDKDYRGVFRIIE